MGQSQIEVTRMFITVTDDFTSKFGISSHLNLKKLTSYECVYDHAIFIEHYIDMF